MSVRFVVVVQCALCGEQMWRGPRIGEVPSLDWARLRAELAQQGWETEGDARDAQAQDFCPDCKPKE